MAIDDVALLETNVLQRSPSATALAVITGVSVAVTAFCLANPKACFGSCPTFSVSDGKDAVLQAEGFSSSVAPSLEARDVDALDRVHPRGRDLIVTMKNEALETHVVRHVRVLAAERPQGGRVMATVDGAFREASDVRAVQACWADEGACFVKAQAFDGDERFSFTDRGDLARREVVELQLPPADGPRGLVLAFRQTLASTYLFYQSLAWLGRSASDALAALERGDSAVGGALTRLRDAVGGIEVLAETGGGTWVPAGEVREMGPLATDVVVVPLPADATGAGSACAWRAVTGASTIWRQPALARALSRSPSSRGRSRARVRFSRRWVRSSHGPETFTPTRSCCPPTPGATSFFSRAGAPISSGCATSGCLRRTLSARRNS